MSDLPARSIAGGTAFIDAGQGEAVVLVHGVGLNAEIWAPQIEALSRTHRVIALDMPGHGGSAPLADGATLDDYVARLPALLDSLGIASANVVGHSMGGLVALGFALAHPDRTLRVAVLNSVYERGPEARAAVEARASEIARSGTSGDIEQPLRRWFGDAETPARFVTRQILQSVDPQAYAVAYRVFATGDRAFSGRLGNLAAPALFATGTRDANSTPAMAEAMAKAAPRGKALVIEGERHMMPLTAAAATTAAIRNLLAEPLQPIAPRDLRQAFGAFMTGVTVITTLDETGTPRGFTANSFTSVSLDPPLLLICIGKNAMSHDTFSKAPGFAVNILAETQKEISGIFASKRPDKFTDVAWRPAASGNPLIDGSIAWFDCARHEVIDAGDHIILLGAIRTFAHTDANPLGYARGGYVTLGLEQAAVNAASGGRTVVGAILECDGRLVMVRDGTGRLGLPEAGRSGPSGSASLLSAALRQRGLDASLGFLFAVYENPETRVQAIYYRGDAALKPGAAVDLVAFDAIPWDQLPDEATRIMLRRYSAERLQGRFKIYSGDHERGVVTPIE